MESIYVFIVEDTDVAHRLIKDHFDYGKITHAAVLESAYRPDVCEALDRLQEN